MSLVLRCECGHQEGVVSKGALFHLHGALAVPMSEACALCGKPVEIGDWPFCPHGSFRQAATAFDKQDTAVIWENPKTGEVRYPGRADRPMPERYAQQGYVRRELRSDRDYAKFESQQKVLSERRWFNKGSGKSFDNDGALPPRRY